MKSKIKKYNQKPLSNYNQSDFFKMTDPKKIRNKSSNPGVARNREVIYREVIERYNKAMADGFYLEAICLTESLICDRLESRLEEIKQTEILFDVLGSLCSK